MREMGRPLPGQRQAHRADRRDRQEPPHDFLYTETLNEAIWSDPGFNGGWYSSNADVAGGLARHAKIWSVVGFSTEFWKREHWRTLGFASVDDFQQSFMEPYFAAMDPNDLLRMAWKWQRGDVSRNTGGDLAAALGRITAKTFVMPINETCSSRARLRGGTGDDPGQRAPGDREHQRSPWLVRHRAGVDRHLGELLATSV